MNSDWQAVLERAGARISPAGIVSFRDTGAEPSLRKLETQAAAGPVLVDLSHLAVVEVLGEDAGEFLQSQLCNDIQFLDPSKAQLSGYCTPKGRLLGLFMVSCVPLASPKEKAEGPQALAYRLVMPADICDALVKRLTMYVLRAKVKLVRRDDLVCTGVTLPVTDTDESNSLLAAVSGDLPAQVMDVAWSDECQLVRCRNAPAHAALHSSEEQSRFLLVSDVQGTAAVWTTENVQRTGAAHWMLGDILAGVPTVVAATADQFIPQMLNMQLIDALSFKKGCYPGQEIVARMQYLGKLKRQMRLFSTNLDTGIEPGTALSSGDDEQAGQVVDAVHTADSSFLLAVIKIDKSADSFTFAGKPLAAMALPYALEN